MNGLSAAAASTPAVAAVVAAIPVAKSSRWGQQPVAFASLFLQRLCFACSAAANLKTWGFEQHVFAC
jgi:hypothetical protein